MPEWAQDWATGTGKRIREARLEKGWSQEGLSRAAVVSYTTVNKLENGRQIAEVNTIEALAQVLEVDPMWLLGLLGNDSVSDVRQPYPSLPAAVLAAAA
jgi:transcriptional regulator with XRE-family HTH domain